VEATLKPKLLYVKPPLIDFPAFLEEGSLRNYLPLDGRGNKTPSPLMGGAT
jgi:hypothetical protein